MPDEALKGPQITEHRNPLPCKVGDKGLYSRHGEEIAAEVICIYSNGLVDINYGQHDNGEPKNAVSIPVKFERPANTAGRWFVPGASTSPPETKAASTEKEGA